MGARRVVSTVLALALLGACSHHPTSAVHLPGRAAPPNEVLTAYLGALQAGDCQTAHALATSTFVHGNGDLCGVITLKDFTMVDKPAEPGDGEAIFSTELTTEGGDQTMPDGHHTWFYSLRKQPSGEWRLVSGGTGP